MLVKIHYSVATCDENEIGPLVQGKSCAATGTSGNMLFSDLVDNYRALRDAHFAVWQMGRDITYRLESVTSQSNVDSEVIDELVKCTAFSEQSARPVAPSQEECQEPPVPAPTRQTAKRL